MGKVNGRVSVIRVDNRTVVLGVLTKHTRMHTSVEEFLGFVRRNLEAVE